MIVEHNVETGEIIKREMTVAEIKENEKLIEIAIAEKAAEATKAAEKAALLAKLGITDDEAKLLLS